MAYRGREEKFGYKDYSQQMNFEQVSAREKAFLIPTYDRLPVLLVSGQGCWVRDDTGKEYLDLLGGLAVNSLGHAHPEIMAALRDPSQTLLHVSNLFYHPYQGELAERLCRLAGLDRAFFCNSGTEAVEGALKLARGYARSRHREGPFEKTEVLALDNSFHGRTAGALAATWPEKYRVPFEPLVPDIRFVSPVSVEALEESFSERVCAVLIEVIQGEGGVAPLSEDFLRKVEELCRRSGALLICDEIQCGLGRTGLPFAYQRRNLRPDIVVAAKPLAVGLPLGAILASDEVAQVFQPGSHGSTFGGGPLQCRLALKFLEILERPGFLDHVRAVGSYFRGRLQDLAQEISIVQEVRGEGLMIGVELEVPGKEIVKKMLEAGFLINCTQEKVLRFLPPLILEREQVDRLVEALGKTLAAVSQTANPERVRA